MGLEDKGRNVVIHHLGGAKDQAGRLTGNGQLQREGQADPVRAKFGRAAETGRVAETVQDASPGSGGNVKAAAGNPGDRLGNN